jgi:hypothetical protein
LLKMPISNAKSKQNPSSNSIDHAPMSLFYK